MKKQTPHQKAEAALTAFGLRLPETSRSRGWATTRTLLVKGRMFGIFGDKGEADDALTLIVKLPVSAEMVQDLPFVRASKGWFKQHDWVIAHFDADDDIAAEMGTLKSWLVQSWRAMAPKRLVKAFDAPGGL